MQERSIGVTALAVCSVVVALYCQFAAVALILTGAVYSPTGSMEAAWAIVIGTLFFGLTFTSYFLGYGFWARKHWSWAGGIVVLVTLVVASMSLSLLATSFISSVLPISAAVAGIWFLNRPAIKAELLGPEDQASASISVHDAMNAAEPAH